jgi:branched-chain amino acid transport system substrate-binding protein
MKRILLLTGIFFLFLALVSFPLLSACAPSATTTQAPTTKAPAPPPTSSAPPPSSSVAPPPPSSSAAPPPSSPAPSAAQPQILKIGVVTSITGPIAPGLKAEYDAAKPTQDLINQMGGITINGQKYNIELTVQDDKSSPPDGVAAANRLIQDGVKFIVAPIFPPVALAMLPICTQAKVITMAPSQSDPAQFNKDNPYNFCAFMLAYNTPTIYAHLQKNYPQVKSVAFISPDDPGINITFDLAVQEAQKRGLTVADKERFPTDTADFSSIVTKMLAQKPDAIDLVGGLAIWSTNIINNSNEQGFSGPIFCDGIFGDPNLLVGMVKPQYLNNLFEGCPDVTSDQMSPIVKQLRPLVEKSGSQYIYDSANLLSATTIILSGIQNAQSLDTDKVKAALEAMGSVNSVWGGAKWGGQDLGFINHMVKLDRVPISTIMNGKVTFEFASP